MKRVRKQIKTLAEAQSENIILLEGESYFVNNNGVIEHWIGLDGVRERDGNNIVIAGTAFNSLPSYCKINAVQASDYESLDYVWDYDSSEYVQQDGVKKFYGPTDPGPNGLGIAGTHDVWEQTTVVAAPTNFQSSISNLNTVNLSWVDNADNEDGYYIYKSSAFFDWTLDVVDGQTLDVGSIVLYSGQYYICDTQHSVGTPKTFTSGNFSSYTQTFSLIHTTAAGATSYAVTGNAYSSRFTFKVTAFKGAILSVSSPTTTIKTSAASTSQTSMIAGLDGLWSFVKCYDSGSPLTSEVGGRSFTGQVNTLYQQAAIETSDSGDYSIRSNNNETGWIYRAEVWSLGQNWEMGALVRIPESPGFVGGKALFGLYNSANSNNKIRVWTDSTTPNKLRLSLINSSGSWFSGAVGTATLVTDTTYFVSVRYDHASTTLSVYVNGVLDSSMTVNLSSGYTVDRVAFCSDGTNRQTMFLQKAHIIVGSYMSDQNRLDIYNAGVYA